MDAGGAPGQNTMKKNTKFLWIYTGILFSFALILIVFAFFTQNNIQKENEENIRGMRSSVSQLTEENEMLKKELEAASALLADTTKKLEETQAVAALAGNSEYDALLMQAYDLYREGKVSEARALLAEMNTDSFSVLQRYLYDLILS